jgi:hypothetical protein
VCKQAMCLHTMHVSAYCGHHHLHGALTTSLHRPATTNLEIVAQICCLCNVLILWNVLHHCLIWDSPNLVRVRVIVTLRLTVCQSVRLGVEPTLGLTTRCYFPLEVWCLKFSVFSLFGHPLWREVGSVICQSKSIVICQGKIHIYIFCVIHISKCTYNNTRPPSVPARYNRLCPIIYK